MKDFGVNDPTSSFVWRLKTERYKSYRSIDHESYYDRDGPLSNLWKALGYGDCDGVKKFIKQGADPNAADKEGVTPLMFVAARGLTDIASVLIAAGANIDARDKNGKTALMAAVFNAPNESVYRYRTKIAMMLLEKGANPNVKDKDGSTALMLTAFTGSGDVAMALLERGAKPDIADKNGTTALMLAAYNNKERIARILLEGGALPNIKDNRGSTALAYATFYVNRYNESIKYDEKKEWSIAALRLLLEGGANPDACVTEGGDPLLIWAVKNDSEDLVGELIAGGADPKVKAKDRWTALAYTDNESIVEMLYAAAKRRNASMRKGD